MASRKGDLAVALSGDSRRNAAGVPDARVLESIQDAVVRFDCDWRYVYVNDRLCELSGAAPQERIGRVFWDVFPEFLGTEVERRFRAAMRDQQPHVFELHYPPWGRWLETRLYPTPDGLTVLLADVTERVRTRRELAKSQTLFRTLVEGITEHGVYMIDPDGCVSSWNPGAQRIDGYRADEILGKHFSCFHTAESRAAGEPARALAVASAEGKYSAEGWRVRKDGSRFWAIETIDAVRDAGGELLGFATVTRDMTERHRLERVREFALRQQQALDDERLRISRALHDDLGHRLALIAMDAAEAMRSPLTDEQRALMTGIRATTHECAVAMREIIADLRPPELEEFGLKATLEALVDRWSRRSGVSARCAIDIDVVALVAPTQHALFSLVQEGLSNVARHAQASNVRLSIARAGDTVRLELRDDGCGIRDDDLSKVGHFGLIGIAERVKLLGGQFAIKGSPRGGTVLTVSVPLPV